MKTITVYSITNIVTGRVYVGATTVANLRFAHHRWHIKNKCHHNPNIREDSKHYKLSKFRFDVLESKIAVADRGEREDYWMTKLNSLDRIYGYNVQRADNYTHDTSTRLLISKNRCRVVSSYDPTTKLLVKTYPSFKEASADISGYHSHISISCSKGTKYKQLLWRKGSAKKIK